MSPSLSLHFSPLRSKLSSLRFLTSSLVFPSWGKRDRGYSRWHFLLFLLFLCTLMLETVCRLRNPLQHACRGEMVLFPESSFRVLPFPTKKEEKVGRLGLGNGISTGEMSLHPSLFSLLFFPPSALRNCPAYKKRKEEGRKGTLKIPPTPKKTEFLFPTVEFPTWIDVGVRFVSHAEGDCFS